jgi:hypothetical protein
MTPAEKQTIREKFAAQAEADLAGSVNQQQYEARRDALAYSLQQAAARPRKSWADYQAEADAQLAKETAQVAAEKKPAKSKPAADSTTEAAAQPA